MMAKFAGDVEADEFDLGVVIPRDNGRVNGGDEREGADGNAIEVIGRTAEDEFLDLELVIAGIGKAMVDEWITGSVEAVVAGDDFAGGIEEAEDKIRFRRDGFCGSVEHEVIAGLSREVEGIGIAAGVVRAPDGDGERGKFLGGGRFRFDELREVVDIKFQAGGFAGRRDDAEFVDTARKGGSGRDFDPEFGLFRGGIGEDGGGEVGIEKFNGGRVLQMFAGEF